MKKVMNIFILIWLVFFVFNGPLRFYLTKYGLTYMVYLPNLLLVTIIFLYLNKVVKELKIQKQLFIFFVLLFWGILIGFFNDLNTKQIVFSLNIYLPFLAGFIYAYYYKANNIVLIYIYRIVTPIVLLGISLDYFYKLPWQGYIYEIRNFSIEGSRYWTTFGIERLAGFQRSSIEAGILIFILLTINLTIRLHSNLNCSVFLKYYDFILNILGIFAIYFTTFKTALLSIILLNILWILIILYRNIKWNKGKIIVRLIIKSQMVLLLIYTIIPPFISLLGMKLPEIKDGYLRILFTSYINRIQGTWPNAYNLLGHSNFPFFGRGLGGIGTAQQNFESHLFNPGDNFFVYMFVSFGLISIFIMLYFIIKVFTININIQYNMYFLISLLIIFSFGATINVIESGGLMLLIASFLAIYQKKKYENLAVLC